MAKTIKYYKVRKLTNEDFRRVVGVKIRECKINCVNPPLKS